MVIDRHVDCYSSGWVKNEEFFFFAYYGIVMLNELYLKRSCMKQLKTKAAICVLTMLCVGSMYAQPKKQSPFQQGFNSGFSLIPQRYDLIGWTQAFMAPIVVTEGIIGAIMPALYKVFEKCNTSEGCKNIDGYQIDANVAEYYSGNVLGKTLHMLLMHASLAAVINFASQGIYNDVGYTYYSTPSHIKNYAIIVAGTLVTVPGLLWLFKKGEALPEGDEILTYNP